MAEVTETDASKSWLVQEVPSVGWVIKPGPLPSNAEGAADVELGASEVASPARRAEGAIAPSEPVPALTVPAGQSSPDPRATSEAESEPLPLPNAIASPLPPQSALRSTQQSADDGPRAAGQAAGDARSKAMTRRSSGFDAFIIYALESAPAAKTGAGRATAISRGLKDRGLRICTQSFLAGAVKQHLSSSDEAHFMAQAAQNSDCAVILLTRQFIERVETGLFGDSCVAAFTLAKRLPNAIMAALEPDLANPSSWGWNQVFARFSGRAVVDLSMRESDPSWQDAVDRLAWLLNPQLELTRSPLCTASGSGPPLSSELGPERSDPDFDQGGLRRGYDCFISHNWGKDSQGRDNHQRVMQIASSLQSRGIQVFLQDREAHRYSSTDEAMVDGMRRSSVALIFVTRSYIQKIEDGKVDDDCVAQFNLAKRAPAILPVVLEPELVKTGKWGWNRVYAHLSGKMIVDLSRGEVMGFPAVLASAAGQRMQSQLDLLELRILQEAYRLHPKLMQAQPAPLVPHQDIVMISAVCLNAGALLHVGVVFSQTAMEGTLSFFVRLVATVSTLCWLIGFVLYALWLVMKARQPPGFDLVLGLVQPVALLGNACRAIAWALFLMRHVMILGGVEDLEANAEAMNNSTSTDLPTQDFGWATQVGTVTFTVGCVVCLLDAWLLSRGRPGGFQERGCSAESLGGWAWVSMAVASILMTVSMTTMQAWQPESAALEIPAALLLLLGAALLLLWLLLHPKQLRRHLERLAGGPTPAMSLAKAAPLPPAAPLAGPPLATQAPAALPGTVDNAAQEEAVAASATPQAMPQAPPKTPADAVVKAPEEAPPAIESPSASPCAPAAAAPAAEPSSPEPPSTLKASAQATEPGSPGAASPVAGQSSQALSPKSGPKAGYKKRVVSSLLKAAKDGSLDSSLKDFEAKEGLAEAEAVTAAESGPKQPESKQPEAAAAPTDSAPKVAAPADLESKKATLPEAAQAETPPPTSS